MGDIQLQSLDRENTWVSIRRWSRYAGTTSCVPYHLIMCLFRRAPLLDPQPFLPVRKASSADYAPKRVSRGEWYRSIRPIFLTVHDHKMSMAHKRQKRAQTIDTGYASEGDVFRSNPDFLRKGYTKQVPAPPIHEGFASIQHQAHAGQIEVDTMILLDVSSSMGWEHRGFDQPRHVGASQNHIIHGCSFKESASDVVHNILRRAINRSFYVYLLFWASSDSMIHRHGNERPISGSSRPPGRWNGYVQLVRISSG